MGGCCITSEIPLSPHQWGFWPAQCGFVVGSTPLLLLCSHPSPAIEDEADPAPVPTPVGLDQGREKLAKLELDSEKRN